MATAGTELTVERRAKAEATLSEPQPPSAQVLLTGPLGAMVFVHGKLHGSLPLESPLSLSPGRIACSSKPAIASTSHELTVRAGEQLQLHLTLPDAVLLLPDEQAMSEVPELMSIARRAAEDAGLIVIPERDCELLVQSSTEYTGCERSLLCMRRVGKMLGAQSVIMLERRLSRVWAGRLVRSDDGALGSATSEGCASCTSDDLAIRTTIRQLIPRRQIPQKPPGQPPARVSSQCRAQPRWIVYSVGAPAATAPGRSVQANGAAVATAQRHGNLARSDGHKPDAALFDGATTSPIASTCAWGVADHRRRRPCGDGNRLLGRCRPSALTAADGTGVLASRSTN